MSPSKKTQKNQELVHWSIVILLVVLVGYVAVTQIKQAYKTIDVSLTVSDAATVPTISIVPDKTTAGMNQNVTVQIQIDTAGQAIDGVDIFSLRYDTTKLQVQDDVGNQTGVQIAPGTLLPVTVGNSVDTSQGLIRFSQTSTGGTNFNGSGTLATVHFRTIGSGASNLNLDFVPNSSTDSNMAFQGADILAAVNNATVTVDGVAPTILMTAPAAGSTVSGTISVAANAEDNASLAGVQFKVDGANLGAEDTSAPFAVSWNTTTVADGSHTLTAVARDAVGNTTTSAPITVTVKQPDTTAPTVSITAPANGSSVSSTVSVTATATDAVGVVGVQFKLDGANLGAEDTSSPYSVSWNTTTATDGPHVLTAVARDAAGNSATSSNISVTVNNAPANQLPSGAIEEVTTTGLIRGWAYDPDTSSTSIQVRIYIDGQAASGTLLGTVTANIDRPDIRSSHGITGNHGFEFNLPSNYKNGAVHSLYAYGIDTSSSSITSLLGTNKDFTSRTITLDPEARPSKVMNATLSVLNSGKQTLKTIPVTTNASGQYQFVLDMTNTNVHFKIAATPFLTRLLSNINLSQTNSSSIVFPKLWIGDLNGDNIINSIDFSTLNSKWFTSDAATDLNADGVVNSVDFSFMNQHWLVTGEQ